MIRIVNLRNYALGSDETLVKVDRSSIVGNPFRMRDERDRADVCAKYETYFVQKLDSDCAFHDEIARIWRLAKRGDVTLGCWCYPKQCHALTIKRFLEQYL